MVRDRQMLKPSWKASVISFALSIALLSSSVALAQSRRYTPPQSGSPPKATGLGGSRGGSCAGGSNTAFTALAPYSHVGQTIEAYPTFVWYVPDSQPRPIDFRLYAYGADDKLQPQPVYQAELDSKPGIMTFTLPQSQPQLSVGHRYYWQAALICDANDGSKDLIVSAEIQRVENSLPESECWYDLFEATVNNTISQSRITLDLIINLVNVERSSSEELARSATTANEGERSKLLERSEEILQHSEQLAQIVKAEQ